MGTSSLLRYNRIERIVKQIDLNLVKSRQVKQVKSEFFPQNNLGKQNMHQTGIIKEKYLQKKSLFAKQIIREFMFSFQKMNCIF